MSELVLASTQLSQRLGVEKGAMLSTIKAQCFRNTHPDQVTDAQLAAFVSVAQSIGVNPLLPSMLYAYPERNGGITPIIGPDGIFSMLANNSDIEGWTTKHEQIAGEPACTATIKHKRLGDISKTVFLSEWKVSNNPNWQTRPRHMLEIRALKQCARQVIHGVPFDEDEHKETMRNVTPVGGTVDPATVEATQPGEAKPVDAAPAAEGESKRAKAPARRGSARAASAEVVVEPETTTAPTNSASALVESPQNAPAAAGQPSAAAPTPAAEPISTTTEVKAATPAPAAETRSAPKDVKAAGAAQETPAAAEPAKPAPVSAAPEVAPGVTLEGLHGKPWPIVANIAIESIRTVVTPTGTPLAIIKGAIEGHDGALEFVTAEHVALSGGKPALTPDGAGLLASGKTINAKIQARLRAGKTTVPPALWAEGVTETPDEF